MGGSGKGGPTVSNADIGAVVDGFLKADALPGTGRKPPENSLYVKGLPYNTTDLDLYRIFSPFGAIPVRGVKANIKQDGLCSGVGWVDYLEPHAADAAMSTLNGAVLPDGVALIVQRKKPHSQ